MLLDEAKRTTFTPEEKQFLEDYQSGAIDRGGEEDIYYYTTEALEFGSTNDEELKSMVKTMPNNTNDQKQHFTHQKQPSERAVVDYSSWTVLRLKDLCREKGLTVSGTKGVLIQRIQDTEEEEAEAEEEEAAAAEQASGTQLTREETLEKYLVDLVKYYIVESRGYATSRDLGRFLSSNSDSNAHSKSALQELKDTFGGLAAFLNQRSSIFTTVREPSDGDPMNYSFGIKLKEARDGRPVPASSPVRSQPAPATNPGPARSQPARSVDPSVAAHIEDLIREYLHASGGEASSRNLGRYLAVNAGLASSAPSRNGQKNTALKQLKENYGSLAAYLNVKEDIFVKIMTNFQSGQGENDQPSEHSFGVRLR